MEYGIGVAWKVYVCVADGVIVEGKLDDGMDGVIEGDEGGGWDVEDELELPSDLVRSKVLECCSIVVLFLSYRCQTWEEELWVEKGTMFPPPKGPVRHR